MEKWCLRLLYIESWSEWELSRLKVSGKSPSVGSAIHRWMCETACRLEHLIAICEPRSVNSKSETCELSTPHVWIEESCGLMSWKSKPHFFLLQWRGKTKVLRGYCRGKNPKLTSNCITNNHSKLKTYFNITNVGVEVQNSYVLGLGLTRVQIDKYWILILIQEPELPRR